jgi:hypothetical protein
MSASIDSPEKTFTIEEALDQSHRATDQVEQAAQDLALVHAVLDKQVPAEARYGDMGHALSQTSALEKQLSESVELLQEANKVLLTELEAKPGASADA